MYSRIRQAVQTAVRRQHLALLLAWGATVHPLVQAPGAPGFSLGPQERWQDLSLPLALRHPLVRLALWIREQRLRLHRRMAFRKST
jgi:hypothetical protein